jgi:hypothetical protein
MQTDRKRLISDAGGKQVFGMIVWLIWEIRSLTSDGREKKILVWVKQKEMTKHPGNRT